MANVEAREGMAMEKKSPAISVIIPMYNVERYIVYCMESLLQQTFTDYEIILVDDASTDNTYLVCQRLFGQDGRVMLLRNDTNKGQCHSRNRGLACARGKYVYFMDSDDEILPHGLETLYRKAEEEKADVVHSNFYAMVYSTGRMRLRKNMWHGARSADASEGLLKGSLAERFEYQAMKSSLPMPWMNLYLRDFLLKEKLSFPNMAISEDDMLAMSVALKAKRFVRINNSFYLYRQHFHDKERNKSRLRGALPLMNKAMAYIDDLFAQYSEEELPFILCQDFKAGWLRAHLRPWLFNLLDSRKKEDMEAISELLDEVSPEYKSLLAAFFYMLDNDTGLREHTEREQDRQRKIYRQIFKDWHQGTGGRQGDYEWLYAKARLAVSLAGGETAYYRDAYRYWAWAASRLGKYQEALEVYQEALGYAESYSKELLEIFDEYLCTLHYLDVSAEDIARVHRLYASQLPEIDRYSYEEGSARKKGKIRIGYLSAHFCRHRSFGAIYALLFCYDKEEFEVYCYHCGEVEDGYTKAVRNRVDKFVSLPHLSHRDMAEAIHADGVDVLVDLMGHSPGNALPVFAYRPAPVQISALGYPSTTGMPEVDYYLTDEVIDSLRKNEEALMEKPLFLPSRLSYGRLHDVPLPPELPFRKRGYITFGVFAPYCQLNDGMIVLWQQIMAAVPDSRLLVKAADFDCEGMKAEATDRFFNLGFELEQVQFESDDDTSLDGFRKVDIVLDTWPCPGGVRMLESLYMGVPVISLYGERRDTRVGLSILKAMGMEELAAESREAYRRKATELAVEPEKLWQLHQNLRVLLQKESSLTPVRYACEFEAALKNII